jgi:Domain of Unknown Function (DUF349)
MTEKTSQPEKEKDALKNEAPIGEEQKATDPIEIKKEETTDEQEAIQKPAEEVKPIDEEVVETTASDEVQPIEEKAEAAIEPEELAIVTPSEDIEDVKVEATIEEEQPEAISETKNELVADAPISETTEENTLVDDVEKPEGADDSEDEEALVEETETSCEEMSDEELVQLLEETVKETDISKIKARVALIKMCFVKITNSAQEEEIEKTIEDQATEPPKEADPLQERFDAAFGIYRQNKIRFNENLEVLKKGNLEQKKQILEDLKELINSEETLKNTYDHFRQLQDSWKDIGMVPRNEVNNLWQNYHFLVEKFFDKVKINKELRDLDLKKNLEAKMQLCEQAEELLIETSIIKSFRELQKLHERYKEIGPVPTDKKDEVWERFKTATDKINELRREHYAQLADQQGENLNAKTALCEKADEFLLKSNTSMKDWQENTHQMNELFKVWKTIGPCAKKENDEIWLRFKAALNTFFENRREYFNQVKEQQLNNYNIKLDLCAQSEALLESTEWKNTTEELIRLQKEWRKIGPVPRKFSDKVWKRFRAANDSFFNRKSEFFANIHEHEAKNLELRLEVIEKIKSHGFGEDKKENLQAIKDFQRQWMEIGHVPIKEKDKIQNEFRKVIDAQLEKLKISAVEISTLAFKSKVENLKDDPNAKRALSRERAYLVNKASKLKEDIQLWENNVGFFASSKNADVLKNEFLKKIEKAKEELKLMQEKVKFLNSQS